MRLRKRAFEISFLAVLSISLNALGICIYVSPQGNDHWSGTINQPNAEQSNGPLLTLTAARDKIRELKSAGKQDEPIEIVVASRSY